MQPWNPLYPRHTRTPPATIPQLSYLRNFRAGQPTFHAGLLEPLRAGSSRFLQTTPEFLVILRGPPGILEHRQMTDAVHHDDFGMRQQAVQHLGCRHTDRTIFAPPYDQARRREPANALLQIIGANLRE